MANKMLRRWRLTGRQPDSTCTLCGDCNVDIAFCPAVENAGICDRCLKFLQKSAYENYMRPKRYVCSNPDAASRGEPHMGVNRGKGRVFGCVKCRYQKAISITRFRVRSVWLYSAT